MDNVWFLDNYGNEKVQFNSYWKYTFTFCNSNVLVSIGGSSDDIYRLDVSQKPIKIKDLLAGWEDFYYEIKVLE